MQLPAREMAQLLPEDVIRRLRAQLADDLHHIVAQRRAAATSA
eukprot:CAMPEP_0179482490 /NCGR_PEP_ID=MMETSP0799-20121207/60002_1 /TAXON_ID=46947 /ORGANISM="Geminigera cryophila, Strain CCMP2564" /LENGTH=42 /DNA_ID= /DNA_START= /DNA_END= /DNA_ORIENTATION=